MMTEQMYVEELKPATTTQNHPIVFWHGMCQTGASWLTTPDGRPGWASYFLNEGYTVYVVDSPERGRSAHAPGSSKLITISDSYVQNYWTATSSNGNLWPQACLHTQWPGTGKRGDPTFDAFMASQIQSRNDYLAAELLAQRLGADLFRKIGPAILCTHSQGGSHGWLIADAVPHLVKAIIALEPVGPPFVNRVASVVKRPDPNERRRPYGITMAPITYQPPITTSDELKTTNRYPPDETICEVILQADPPRQLPNLRKVPVLIMTSESGYHAHYDHATVTYLRQAGVDVTWLELPKLGIKGNGHFMFMEQNSVEIAEHVRRWLVHGIRGL